MAVRKILIAACAVGCVTLALAGPSLAQAWQRSFMEAMKDPSSDVRRNAIYEIDPDARGGIDALIRVLTNKNVAEVDWYQIRAVIEQIGDIREETSHRTLDRLLQRLVRRSADPDLLAPLLQAAALTRDERYHPYLEQALSQRARHPVKVKRVAVRAMGETRNLDFVEPILGVWKEADEAMDYRTILACREALRELTEEDHGRDYAAWQRFWDEEGEGFVPASQRRERPTTTTAGDDEERERRTTTVTRTREIPLEITTTGREDAIPLLVIHDTSWGPGYYDPYLSALDDIFRIHYVRLPTISELERIYEDEPDKIERNIGGYPYYPYDALCDAFDDARKELGYDKFALFADGFSTMVAQRYLSKYPDNVSHAIFVGTFAGGGAYGTTLNTVRSRGNSRQDRELIRAVDFHYITDEKTFTRFYDPADDQELQALMRKWFTIRFADPRDPEIGEIWERARTSRSMSLERREREQSQSPPYDLTRERRPNVPVLVVSGGQSMWFTERDGHRVAENYPRSRHVVLPEAASMPWFDDPGGFQKAVRDFMNEFSGSPERRRR